MNTVEAPVLGGSNSSTFASSKFLALFATGFFLFPLLVIIIASSFQTDIVNHRPYANLRLSADYTGETYTIGDDEFDVYTWTSPTWPVQLNEGWTSAIVADVRVMTQSSQKGHYHLSYPCSHDALLECSVTDDFEGVPWFRINQASDQNSLGHWTRVEDHTFYMTVQPAAEGDQSNVTVILLAERDEGFDRGAEIDLSFDVADDVEWSKQKAWMQSQAWPGVVYFLGLLAGVVAGLFSRNEPFAYGVIAFFSLSTIVDLQYIIGGYFR